MATVTAQQAKAHASRGVKVLARAGYAARGVIYLLIGGLALLSALGSGSGETTDSKGALEKLLAAPAGWVILLAVGAGLFGFAIWRAVQAGFDTDRHGTDLKGMAVRAGQAGSALAHVGLAVWAVRRAVGYAADSGSSRESWTAWFMGQPFGRVMVAVFGGVVIGAGIAQIVKGWRGDLRKRLEFEDSQAHRLIPACRFGIVARGVVFGIIGAFFLYAAWTYDASKAGGIAQAFVTMRRAAFGQIVLAAAAAGLMAFSLYSFVQARFRRIDSPG